MSSSTDTATRLSLNGHSSPGETQLHFESDAKFGEEQSKRVGGDPQMLRNFLYMFYDQDNETAELRQRIHRLEAENEKNKKNVVALKDGVDARRIEIQKSRHERERLVLDRQDNIAAKKVEIKRIRGGDYSLLDTDQSPANRPAYWTAVFILAILTLYLINFYASVIYNAFLLDPLKMAAVLFQDGIVETVTIANLKAFRLVYADYGILGVVFLISSTFVFITLGFLVYWFSKNKSNFWQYALYVFTFLFDAFLAYEIVYKMHLSQGYAGEMPPWQFTTAFQQMEFYIILCAGFGIYVAWGLLLRYVLEEYHRILPAIAGIRRRKAEIKRLEGEIKDIDNRSDVRIRILEKEITDIEQKEIGTAKHAIEKNLELIQNLRREIQRHLAESGLTAKRLRSQITAFLSGWCNSILEYGNGTAEAKIKECHGEVNRFYETIGLE